MISEWDTMEISRFVRGDSIVLSEFTQKGLRVSPRCNSATLGFPTSKSGVIAALMSPRYGH